MKTKSKFICPNCGVEDHQGIIFLASDFAFKCNSCESIHCFEANLYWDFVDNFKTHGCSNYKWNHNSYIGSITKENKWISPSMKVSYSEDSFWGKIFKDGFQRMTLRKNENKIDIVRCKISGKQDYHDVRVANAILNHHFLDCFRGLVRMKENLSDSNSFHSYNILITDHKMNMFLDMSSKLKGLDELWIVPWKQSMDVTRVSAKSTTDDEDTWSEAWGLSNSITECLNEFENHGLVVSKAPGPTIYGKSLLEDLFRINTNKPLYLANHNLLPNKKYVAILVHSDTKKRSGFGSKKQLTEVCDLVRRHNLEPVIIACDSSEKIICIDLSGTEKVLIAPDMQDQILFYSQYCIGAIGTNCSGCNFPAFYGVPILSFVKTRPFPDDFYCFGRLSSKYNCAVGYNGDLEKADNIVEVMVDCDRPTSVLDHIDQTSNWLKSLPQDFNF